MGMQGGFGQRTLLMKQCRVLGKLNPFPHCWALVAALPEPGQATSYWLFHAYQDLCAEFCYKASKLFACQWDINESWAPKAPRVQGSLLAVLSKMSLILKAWDGWGWLFLVTGNWILFLLTEYWWMNSKRPGYPTSRKYQAFDKLPCLAV